LCGRSTADQPENPKYGKKFLAPAPAAHAAIATLTAGPVAPGDNIDKMNKELLLKSCRSDGLLLKPSYPATAIDSYYHRKAFGQSGPDGELYSTYSEISSHRWVTVIAMDMKEAYELRYDDLKQKLGGTHNTGIAYQTHPAADLNSVGFIPFSSPTDGIPVKACALDDFQLWHTAPAQCDSTWALMGQLTKWVPASSRRFTATSCTEGSLVVSVSGAAGEAVDVSFASLKNGGVVVAHCTLGYDGTAKAKSDSTCTH